MDINLEKIKEVLMNVDSAFVDPSVIRENKFIFPYQEQAYRLVMPTQRQLSAAEDAKNKLYSSLVKQPGYEFKETLKKILKQKGVDIEAMEEEKEVLLGKWRDAQVDLILNVNNTKTVEQKREADLQAKTEYILSCSKITQYLSPSIEFRLDKEYIEYLTFVCTQKCVKDDEWTQAWKTYDEFQNDKTELPGMCVEYMTKTILSF